MIANSLLTLQEQAESIYEARASQCLAQVPVVLLSVGNPSGGRFTLIHKGHRETVEPVDESFEILKYLGHAPLGLFGSLFPGPTEGQSQNVGDLELYLQALTDVQKDLDLLPLDDACRQHCGSILEASVALARRALESHVDQAGFTEYARSISRPISLIMREAARVQLDGITMQLESWKNNIPEVDWDQLVAAVGSGWARINNSPRMQAIALVMGEKKARERLFCIQGVKTEEALLDRLASILNQHELGELFFEEIERMDEDLMGRPATEILQERSNPCVAG